MRHLADGDALVLTGAALCPATPLLHPAVTGRAAVVPELRAACAQAVKQLLTGEPDTVVVIGPAAATGQWNPFGRLDPSIFAPGLPATGHRLLPPALGLGAFLLDQAGYAGRRRLQAVGHDEPVSACVRLGRRLSETGTRSAVLVMGDGSARRTLKAPGYLDERAPTFDAEVERAVRAGDLSALERLDQSLAHDLMASGRPAWQVLSGAWRGQGHDAEVLYCDAPFGVGYLVAYLRPPAALTGFLSTLASPGHAPHGAARRLSAPRTQSMLEKATKSSTTRQYERPGTAGSSSHRHRRARTRGPAPAQRRINRTQALRPVPATRFAAGHARLGLHGSAFSRPARSCALP
jgi:hypothetical protein